MQTQSRLQEVNEQKHAVTVYRRTEDAYAQYRESNWSQHFYDAHRKEIEDHQKAQAVFSKADGTHPTLTELSAT